MAGLVRGLTGSAGAVNSAKVVLTTSGESTSVSVKPLPGWYVASASCTDLNAGASGNPTGNLATVSGSTWHDYTLTMAAANIRSNANIQCALSYSQSAIRLITVLGGPRINEADQFAANVLDANNTVNVNTTTTGAGSTVTGGDSGWKTFNWNGHTLRQTMATGSVSTLVQYSTTVSCTNAATAGSNVSAVSKIGDSFTTKDGDAITCTITNTPKATTLSIEQTLSDTVHRYPVRIRYAANNGWLTRELSALNNAALSTDVQTLTAAAVQMQFALTVPNANWRIGSVACTDSNATVSGNPSTAFGSILGRTSFGISAANVRAGAKLKCAVLMFAPEPF